MLAALLLAADAAEKSKAPFYIFAALLILFGFGLGIVGSRSAGTFPPTAGAGRAVIGVGVLLVAGTMATAVLTA